MKCEGIKTYPPSVLQWLRAFFIYKICNGCITRLCELYWRYEGYIGNFLTTRGL